VHFEAPEICLHTSLVFAGAGLCGGMAPLVDQKPSDTPSEFTCNSESTFFCFVFTCQRDVQAVHPFWAAFTREEMLRQKMKKPLHTFRCVAAFLQTCRKARYARSVTRSF
jgi:hypothetical protein